MVLFIKLAIRNVKRNRKATTLNGIGISLSAIVLMLIMSLSNGITSQIVTRNIQFETGGISIKFNNKIASYQNKEVGDSLYTKVISILKDNKEISSYSFRIYPSNSILYFDDESQSINLIGLVIEKDTSYIKSMVALTDQSANIFTNTKGIIISNAVADICGMSLGSSCNLLLQSVDGTINVDEFFVTGIFQYTSQLNKYNIYANYNEVKKLYNANLPSRIFINIKNLEKANEVKREILEQLGYCGNEFEGEIDFDAIKVSAFTDYMGIAKSISAINKYGLLGLASFLILISFVGIWSMQVENINGRKKEIGSLLSFGFSYLSIKKIFIYESLYISFLCFIVGIICVFSLIVAINYQNGINLGDSASFAFGSAIINPILVWNDILLTFVIVLIYPFIATIISLRIVRKTKIVDLLKGN